jgi:hypothetical protein
MDPAVDSLRAYGTSYELCLRYFHAVTLIAGRHELSGSEQTDLEQTVTKEAKVGSDGSRGAGDRRGSAGRGAS